MSVQVDVDRITILLPPSLFLVPIHNSLCNTSDNIFEMSARPKLVSVPFSSLLLDIGFLENTFPESVM